MGVRVPVRRVSQRLILRVMLTRKTPPLDAVIKGLVSEVNSGVNFDYAAVPFGYPLSAITVDMAHSAFILMHDQQFGVLFHRLCGEKSAKSWIRRAQRLRAMLREIEECG